MMSLRHSPNDRPIPAAGLPSLDDIIRQEAWPEGTFLRDKLIWRPCDTAPMIGQHLLQDCPLHDVTRQEAWPEDTPLRDKLYGDIAALRRTAAFTRATGVPV